MEYPKAKGGALLQTDQEWSARTQHLADSLASLISQYQGLEASAGLDIGCQTGFLTSQIAQRIPLNWRGVDPKLQSITTTETGVTIGPGRADIIEYPDQTFDVLVLANVFEHIPPQGRQPSFDEMFRVLRPGGVLVGQIPNPWFLVESHSRLPFLGWLPISLQKHYWKLAPVDWEHDFWSVTTRHMRRHADAAGFQIELVRGFNYPDDAIPEKVRGLYRAMAPVMKRYPWSWQFVLRRL